MTVQYKTENYGELMELYSELPQEVLDTLVMVNAWWLLNKTGDYDKTGCQFCYEVESAPYEHTVEQCEHYDFLGDVIFPAQWKLWESVGYDKFNNLDSAGPLYLYEPDWQQIEEGYYAVPDPRPNLEEMTYWRRSSTKRGAQKFSAWPQEARYGWVLYNKMVPKDLPKDMSRNTYVQAYYETLVRPYDRAIVEAIQEDPIAARQRFADLTVRCCNCGKTLTNDLSKTYGIGPECRKGLSSEVLANYFRPEVAKAHMRSEHEES